jgi:hypothetical protein
MMRLIAAFALVLLIPPSGCGQNSVHPPHGLGYGFVGLDTSQMGSTAGFGVEGFASKGLGVGLELAAAGLGDSANGNINTIGLGSADVSYHLFTKKAQGRVAPFVAGGYTNFFGQDVRLLSGRFSNGNYQNGYNVGGGVDIFEIGPAGARFDVRYYGHGGRILWASFPNLAQLSFTAVRFAITFR